jgi:hypothetical protein
VVTDQTLDAMDVLLDLLIEHKPLPAYETLPRTGEGLLPLKLYSLPQPKQIRDVGKYVHFGLEAALKGESPGLYFKQADVIQYAGLFTTNPELVHSAMRNKVLLY